MAETVQIDKILSEVTSLGEKEKIIFFQKMSEIFNNFDDQTDEEVTLESAFGLWRDRNITVESIRQKAWK
jgi:hypothetical protein